MKINRYYVFLIEQFSFKRFQYIDIKAICEKISEIDDNELFIDMINVCDSNKQKKRALMLQCVDKYINYFNSKFNNLYYPLLNLYDKLRLTNGIHPNELSIEDNRRKFEIIDLYKEKISNDILKLLNEEQCNEEYNKFIECINYNMIDYIERNINNHKVTHEHINSACIRVFDYFKYSRKNGVQLDDDIKNELCSEMFNYAYQVYLDNKEICDKNIKANEEYLLFREKEYYNNWGFDDTCLMTDKEYKEALEREKQEVIINCYEYYSVIATRLLKLSKDYKFNINNVFNKIIRDYDLDEDTELLNCFNDIYNLALTMTDDEIIFIDEYFCIDDDEKEKLKDIEYYTEELGYYLTETILNYEMEEL